MTESIQGTLDAERILAGMKPATRSSLTSLVVHHEVDSTNSELLRLPSDQLHASAVIADHQTSGRGRRQRSWHSPPGGNIYLSLGWQLNPHGWPLSTFPLVVALAVGQAMGRAGLRGHGIKWPNDILCNGKKLAGILVEMQSTGSGPAMAVIGVGLNVKMPGRDLDRLTAVIDRPWTDLDSELNAEAHGDPVRVNRNELSSLLLNELIESIGFFETSGFEVFRPAWSDLDLLRGENVSLNYNGRQVAGIAAGVDRDGGLLLQTATDGIQVFHAGEVSLHRE